MPVDLNGNILDSTSITTATFNNSIVTDGLILHLDAGNKNSYPGSGTTWTDLSGKGYDGTLTNGPSFNSQGYISFDGSNDYITTADIDHGTSQFTLETWVYFSSLSTAAALIKKILIMIIGQYFL